MSKIRKAALVGCGVGRNHIVEGFLPNRDKFDLVAICDTDVDRLDRIGNEFGIERRTSRYEDILAMADIDIVDICTPPSLHHSMILSGLAAGKHVICEKPLVASLQEMDEVIEVEKRSTSRLMPIFQYRFGDGIEQVRAIINAGIAGKPYIGSVETIWRRDPEYYAVPWRGKWATELGGVLMTQAIHQHDLFTYLMGDVVRLFGRVATRVNDIEVEDCATASVELSSGALGSFTATLGSNNDITRIRLAFENVSFESDHTPYNPGGKPWQILPRNENTKADIEALLMDWQPVASRYQTQFSRFHDALEVGAPLPVTTADARRSLELVAAFYHSSRTHSDVVLPIEVGHPLYAGWTPKKENA